MSDGVQSSNRIHVVIADDHAMFRDGLASILSAEADLEVVGQGGTAQDAIRLARDLLPEIILLDVDMPGGGLEAARIIAEDCPVNHAKWSNGGCQITMATAPGAHLRYQLDRTGDDYKAVYNQRTATERINSQATELGIERPKLRNEAAIANHNTLLYVLIDLRALRRVRSRQAMQPLAA